MRDLNVITDLVIGCCYRDSNKLGIGFVEKIYENALVVEPRKTGVDVKQQEPVKVGYDEVAVGDFQLDLLVGDCVLVELKAVAALDNVHLAQALNYLRATRLPACLLVHFGTTRIQVRRLHPSPSWKSS